MKIASVGAGTIGRGWACAFLAVGHDVTLVDTQEAVLQDATERVHRTLRILERAGRVSSAREALKRLETTSDLGKGVADASYIQESVLEEIPVKRALWARLDSLCAADVLFGSSTSAIHGSAFMGGLSISARSLVVHPTNPPYLVPLVELCATPWTSTETLSSVERLMKRIGQVPVRIHREVTGYALNRLQAAVVGEALHLVGEGYISAADLDLVMTAGLGFRWALTGPFMTGHLNAPGGYRDYMTRYGDVYRSLVRDLHVDYEWSEATITAADQMIRASADGSSMEDLASWRDNALATLHPILARLGRERVEARVGEVTPK